MSEIQQVLSSTLKTLHDRSYSFESFSLRLWLTIEDLLVCFRRIKHYIYQLRLSGTDFQLLQMYHCKINCTRFHIPTMKCTYAKAL